LGAVISAVGALAQSPASMGAVPDLASVHAERVEHSCKTCHGKGRPERLPAEESLAAVNGQCVACHGSGAALAEALAPKLANKHINPHASHLVAIDCTTCHRGHSASESFCLQCHDFDMPMPGRARAGGK
jgi:fumarate reductase flavoprotein subunit